MILKIPIHSDSNINENYPYIYIYPTPSDYQSNSLSSRWWLPGTQVLLRGTRLVEQFDPVYSSKTILQRRLN